MEPKVLLSIYWHDGIPDGENRINLIADDFDIMDKKTAIEEIEKALMEYGATEISHRYSSGEEHHLTAKIEKKNEYLPDFLANNRIVYERDIQVTVTTVLEHRGRYFKMEEIPL